MSGDNRVPIEGIPLPKEPFPVHPIPLRRNIEEWYHDEDAELQVSLFIRAMIKLKEKAITDQLSYFQIAGIHGFPLVTWNGAVDPKAETPGFYCTHGQPTFPPWHRPYLALFELQLYNIMMDIIKYEHNLAPENEAWIFSANTWRLPYWDWATDSNVPELVRLPVVSIRVNSQTKEKKDFENPLNKFTMPKGYTMGDEIWGVNKIGYTDGLPFHLCKSTSRHGISWADREHKWIDGVVENDAVRNAIVGHDYYAPKKPKYNENVTEAVRRILNNNYFKSYEKFASAKYYFDKKHPEDPTSAKEFLSLEFIHNNIHNWIGGDNPNVAAGHMSSIPVAAFDPIFFLHHCNIDRILAIWQALNPHKWFDDPQKGDPSPNDPLYPFRTKDTNVFYTSATVEDFTKFNYQYPETEHKYPPRPKGQDFQASPENYLPELTKKINDLYPQPDRSHGFSDVQDEDDYVINMVYNRYALGGVPYSIRFYLKESAASGDDSYTPLGTVHTFSTSFKSDGAVHCKICKDLADQDVRSTGQIPIKHALHDIARDTEHKSLETTNPDDVEGYLKDHLHWKVFMLSGAEVSLFSVGLKVSVAKGKVTRFEDATKFAIYKNYSALAAATEGKDGGTDEDEFHYT